MTNLTAAEMGVFKLGQNVEVPLAIQGDGFCFHQSVWFVTGRVPNLPEWPSWASHIDSFLAQAEYLSWEPVFATSDYAGVNPLGCLESVGPGVYLVQLLDCVENNGHWVVFDTKFGVFEPGTGRKNIPLVGWVHFLASRFRIRRILKTNTLAG